MAAECCYVNRVLPESELDDFVYALDNRIAGFDKVAVSETKALVDASTRIPDEEFGSALSAYFRTAGRPENEHRARRLFERGLQKPHGVELDLGKRVAEQS
ncbi:hypothetical protein ACIRU3_44525 [Streptomyces sp. NPDC101151]|uniref:hypothetical protein n=1 Tax=Streptomyces sp. NPDC101151 TaxID=3366115 RepID=UPI0037FF3553